MTSKNETTHSAYDMDSSVKLNWDTVYSRKIWSTMLSMLQTMGDYNQITKLFSQTTIDETHQVIIATQYLCEYNLLPFYKTNEPEFLKDPKLSVNLRNAGNKHFMKNNEEALLLYTKSIAAAPYPTSDQVDSEKLALGFANRSAVYFVMKKYEACLRDIEQALMFNYPGKLKYKLLERRAKCYQSLGRKEDARASAEDAVRHLSTATYLADGKMKSTIDALNKLQLDPGSALCEPPVTADALKPLPQKAYGQHKNIPCASECVDIAYDPKVGRHIVANRDIDPGDVLLIEEPFATLLEQNCQYTHCNNCIKKSDAMIPCTKCDQVMYCTEICRKVSWESCHHLECQIVPALRRLDVTDSTNLLSLRILLVACSKSNGIVELFNIDKILKQNNNHTVGFDNNGKYHSSHYLPIHNLFYCIREEPELKLSWAVSAACILNAIVACTDFFSLKTNGSTIPMEELICFTGGLILKYIHILNTNAFAVIDFVLKFNSNTSKEYVNIASGLYSTLSLLNHSCDPSACKVFHNGAVGVVIARKPIRKGEEVSFSYGDYFHNVNINIRKAELKYKYCFDCQCIACINNWPMYDNLESLVNPTFICKLCRIPLPKKSPKAKNQWVNCTRCNKEYNLAFLHKKALIIKNVVVDIYDASDNMSNPDYIPDLLKVIKSLDTLVLYPNQLMHNCHEYLRRIVKARGNIIIE